MDTKKLKEEIKLLERKLELMEQINKLQVAPSYPVYPYPVYPWDRVIITTSDPYTLTIPCGATSATISGIATCGPVTSGTTVMSDDVQCSYTN